MNQIPYMIFGNHTNPPLLFLHGFMGNKKDWIPIANRFQKNFFCILPDLPGHGENTAIPINILLNYQKYSDQIITLLDQLNINKASLIGYSMGGRIAMYTALSYPNRVESLVLEGANPGIIDEKERQKRKRKDEKWAKEILSNGIEWFVEEWYQNPLFSSLHLNSKLLEEIKEFRKKNPSEWVAKVIQELSPGVQSSMWNRISGIIIPTLLIAGELDLKYGKILEDCSKKIANSKFCILPETGHNCHAESPDLFVDCLEKFYLSLDLNHN